MHFTASNKTGAPFSILPSGIKKFLMQKIIL
jgi:hypothetical protein